VPGGRDLEDRGSGAASRVLLVGTPVDVPGSHLDAIAQRHGWELEFATTLGHTIEICGGRWPAVAVVDVRGVRAEEREPVLRWLRRQARIPLLVVTVAADVDARLMALRVGVDDHAVAPVDERELDARIANLVSRFSRLAVHIVGDLAVDRHARRVMRRGQTITITPNELAVLERLIAMAGRVVSKRELMDAMGSAARSTNAVEVHISSLRRKLTNAGPPLIHTVHGHGYVIRPVPAFDFANRAERLDERERLLREREAAVAERDGIAASTEAAQPRRARRQVSSPGD
jgi:two-component system OmpR family response regulator